MFAFISLNKNHLSINQELIPNLLKMTLPVLLIFHAFVVLFDDTKNVKLRPQLKSS